MLDDGILVLRHLDQIGLHEWHMPARLDQPIGELVRRHLAVLCQCGSSFRRQTLDAGLDRHAAGAAKQLQQFGAPQIDPRLHAEFEPAAG